MATTISKILINNYIFHYEQCGSGPPILFIHGSLCDLRYWKFQIKELSKFFCIYSISLRDYWPNDYDNLNNFSIEQHSKDIICFIENIIKQKTCLVGHSRGGSIALKISINRPDLLNHLIIAEPGIIINNYYNLEKNDNVINMAANFIKNGNINLGLSYFIDNVNGYNVWHKMSSWFKTMVINNAYTLIKQSIEKKYSIDKKDLLKIEIPVLLIGGELSPKFYFNTMTYLNDNLINSNFIIIKGSSHGMNIGNVKEFNKIIYNFLLHKKDII